MLQNATHAIIADCLQEEAFSVLASLRRDHLPILSAWQGPLRSLGSTRLQPRTCFIAYCNENVPRLDLRLAMESIRRKVVSPGLLIGAQNLFAENDALFFRHPVPCNVGFFLQYD